MPVRHISLVEESEISGYRHYVPCTESGASAHPAQQALRLSRTRASLGGIAVAVDAMGLTGRFAMSDLSRNLALLEDRVLAKLTHDGDCDHLDGLAE